MTQSIYNKSAAFVSGWFHKYKKPLLESFFFTFLVFVVFMSFKHGIIEWTNTHIFPLLEIRRNGWSDSLLCLTAMFCGYFSFYKTPKVISTGWLSIMLSGWLLLILFLKYDRDWSSINLFDCHWLPYVGVLLFSLTIPWLVKYIRYICKTNDLKKRQQRNRESEPSGFQPVIDNAIQNGSDDKFGWSDHVRRLIREVTYSSDKASISMAITGSWGSGKTSYLNLLKEELESRKEEFIIMEFNPRRSASASNIQNDFLCQLRSNLSDYNCSIGIYISKYIKALQIIDEKSLLPKLISLTGIDSPEHYKKSIEEVIKSTGKTLVVLIDDLDRLTGIEIMEVLKLVNLNVNFEHSIFISAFDKDYVEKALSSIIINREAVANGSSGIRNYTDKYFTFERPLPSVKPHRLVQYLYDIITTSGKYEEDIDSTQSIKSLLDSNLSLIAESIPTIRDVKRFVNLFMPAYRQKKNDVAFNDYFLLCLLRYSYPDTYEKIRCKEIVGTNAIDNTSQVFRLESSDNIKGNHIVSILFEKHNKISAFSLDRRHFKSIRHIKAFPFYFYEYDESSICFNDYIKIADPNTPIHTAKQMLQKLVNKRSDTYSILDLIYDDAVRMMYHNKEAYKRSIELRVSIAKSLLNITVGNLLYMVNVMPEEDFLIRLGFGEGETGRNSYKVWLKDLIMNFETGYGSQRLIQNMMHAITGTEEEVLDKDTIIGLIRHHLNLLTNIPEQDNIDIDLLFGLLLSSSTIINEIPSGIDPDCLKIASNLLLSHPKLFYPRFFQGFTNQATRSYKIMINPNGMMEILKHGNTYTDLAKVLRNNTDIISKAIVHFYDSYYSKNADTWNISYPEGFDSRKYQYQQNLMTALFEQVL